jgi:hypothetical protein
MPAQVVADQVVGAAGGLKVGHDQWSWLNARNLTRAGAEARVCLRALA